MTVMTLRANAAPFVPTAAAHATKRRQEQLLKQQSFRSLPGDTIELDLAKQHSGVVGDGQQDARGDLLIKELGLLLDEANKSEKSLAKSRLPSSRLPAALPGPTTSWKRLPAAGLFCPCCRTLRSCPFHAVEDSDDVDLLCGPVVQRPARQISRAAWASGSGPRPSCEAAERRRNNTNTRHGGRLLPRPPTEAPPPPPPPGLETILAAKRQGDQRGIDAASSASGAHCHLASSSSACLVDDASTDVSHADSEVSTVASARATRRPRQQNVGGASSSRSSGGLHLKKEKGVERLPYKSAVWPK